MAFAFRRETLTAGKPTLYKCSHRPMRWESVDRVKHQACFSLAGPRASSDLEGLRG